MKKIILSIIITIFLAVSVFAANISDLIAKGDKACKIGNFMAAKKFYKQALQNDPKNDKLWKKYDKALKMLYGGGEEEGGGC
jgi:formaldehyde-activating enzyme involved in methanogenesis